MSALNVPGENDVGFFMNYFTGVNMAQGPVGITFIDYLTETRMEKAKAA